MVSGGRISTPIGTEPLEPREALLFASNSNSGRDSSNCSNSDGGVNSRSNVNGKVNSSSNVNGRVNSSSNNSSGKVNSSSSSRDILSSRDIHSSIRLKGKEICLWSSNNSNSLGA